MAADEVILRGRDGQFVSVAGDDIRVEATDLDSAAVFRLAAHAPEVSKQTTAAIRFPYISLWSSLDDDGGGALHLSAETGAPSLTEGIGDWEAFTLLEYTSGDVQLRDQQGRYWVINGDSLELDTGEGFANSLFRLSSGYTSGYWPFDEHVLLSNREGDRCVEHDGTVVDCLGHQPFVLDTVVVRLDEYPKERIVRIRDTAPGLNGQMSVKTYGNGNLKLNPTNVDGKAFKFRMTVHADNRVQLASVFAGRVQAINGGGGNVNATGESGDSTFFDVTTFFDNTGEAYYVLRSHDGYVVQRKSASSKKLVAKHTLTTVELDLARFDIEHIQTIFHIEDILADGVLSIPTPSGSFVIPGVSATQIDQDEWGAFSGMAGGTTSCDDVIEIPAVGGLEHFSTLTCTGNRSVTIDYDSGAAINSRHSSAFPLNDTEKYFFLRYEKDSGTSLGNVELSGDQDGEAQVAIDHNSPAVFVYTDLQLFGDVANSAGFGISGKANIPFNPVQESLPMRDSFRGQFYMRADLPLPIDSLGEVTSLNVDGDMVLKIDPADLADIKTLPASSVEAWGVNVNSVYLSVDFQSLNVATIKVGQGSLLFNQETAGDPWLAISGEMAMDPSNSSLPFGIKLPQGDNNYAHVDAYFDTTSGDGHPSFVEVRVHFEEALAPGIDLDTFSMDGRFRLATGGLTFDGKARFTGVTIRVEGSADSNGASFHGSVSRSTKGEAFGLEWKLNGTFDLEFDLSGSALDIGGSARLQGCVEGKCDSVNANIGYHDGRLRACTNIPGVGTKCLSL